MTEGGSNQWKINKIEGGSHQWRDQQCEGIMLDSKEEKEQTNLRRSAVRDERRSRGRTVTLKVGGACGGRWVTRAREKRVYAHLNIKKIIR